MSGSLTIRPACAADMEELEALRRQALRRLASSHYAASHIEAGLSSFGALDPELVEGGTYYVALVDGRAVGCGGWSLRSRVIDGDPDRQLEPARDPAQIRAAFVHPAFARQGIARRLAQTAEAAAQQAGFRQFALVSTLNAEPAYRRMGYSARERIFMDLPNQVRLPIVRMAKALP